MIQYATKASGDLQGMRRSEKDVLLNIDRQDKMEESFRQWQDSEQKAYTSLLALEKLPLQPDDRTSVVYMKDNFTTYVEGFKGVLGSIRQGRIKTAQAANDAMAENQ